MKKQKNKDFHKISTNGVSCHPHWERLLKLPCRGKHLSAGPLILTDGNLLVMSEKGMERVVAGDVRVRAR